MDSREYSIITQVAAKEASALTQKFAEGDFVQTTDLFDAYFDHVLSAIVAKVDAFAAANPAPTPAPRASGGGSSQPAGPLQVVGSQYGPLPDWLAEAAAAAGVTRVYDNRNEANAENKRPHFREVGEKGARTKGFWPPKGA